MNYITKKACSEKRHPFSVQKPFVINKFCRLPANLNRKHFSLYMKRIIFDECEIEKEKNEKELLNQALNAKW